MRVYLPTDRIPVRIGEITFWISPLSVAQKSILSGYFRMEGGEEIADRKGMNEKLMRLSVKGVDGVEDASGEPLVLEVGADGELTDDSYEVLKELSGAHLLVKLCMGFVSKIHDPGIEGIKVDLDQVVSVKKKQKMSPSPSSLTA